MNICTINELIDVYSARAGEMLLSGDSRGAHLMRLAHMVWEDFPWHFEDIAFAIANEEDPRSAAWLIQATLETAPGSAAIVWQARGIARGEDYWRDN